MQFRTAGRKTQVLAYAGYDKEKKRAKVEMVASFDTHAPSYDVSWVEGRKTDALEKELTAHLTSIIVAATNKLTDESLQNAAVLLLRAGHILKLDPQHAFQPLDINTEKVAELWLGIRQVEKMLTDSGHPRPKRAYKSAPDQDPRQKPLIPQE